jgi:hypothetical protein
MLYLYGFNIPVTDIQTTAFTIAPYTISGIVSVLVAACTSTPLSVPERCCKGEAFPAMRAKVPVRAVIRFTRSVLC